MSKFRTLLFVTALTAATIVGAAAQSSETVRHIALGDLLNPSSAISRLGQNGGPIPGTNISIRGGAMVAPRIGGVAGVDFSIPSISLGAGWHGRVDADVIFKANFGGINTIIPVTFDQLYYSPNAVGNHNFYWGAGLGVILGGPGLFDGKLILGTELTSRIGAELNVHLNERNTLLTLMARFHL